MKLWEKLNAEIVSCGKCPRLVAYRQWVAVEKKREFRHWDYWGKPVTGFGDLKARILLVGLAPAAHGGNRTGRIFTGDSSAQTLMKALHAVGLASQPFSLHRDDGLKLSGVYLTAVCRCAPPENKPTPEEIRNCLPYLVRELDGKWKSNRFPFATRYSPIDAVLRQHLTSPPAHCKEQGGSGFGKCFPKPAQRCDYAP